MTIQSIIKKAIKRLELEGKSLTPDFYAESFCKEAKKAGFSVDDCSHVKKLSTTLNSEFQKELKNYHIKTISELARFLISKLNRINPTHCSSLLESQMLFTKRVLQVVEVLHNKEASELARKSIDLLNNEATSSQVDQFRQLWINFITSYDDTFLQKLKVLGDIDSRNLKDSIENLHINSSDKLADSMELSSIASLLVASLVPSIASSVNDKIADISQKIQKNPSLLESVSVESEIKSVISLRIALDKQSVKEMIESLDGVLDKLSSRLIDMIESSDNSTAEIQKIKTELVEYKEEPISNFKAAHKKLYTIAVALEENTKALSNNLKDHSGEVKLLGKKIELLEKKLKAAREESKEDFLTKLYNKRALDELMDTKEAEFKRYDHNYSIVFFDLDFFKSINDTYGHDAGDAVLVAFAKILKKESRNVDIVGRFGGEEFIAILGETNADGGAIFANKVRNKVEKARFRYKEKYIKITVSCGVCERKTSLSLQNVIKTADDYLYKAKKNGRNQVVQK
ncbi:MAG: GGDEF domain-containing protein [Sulfurimonas sp.]|nr:GGDEF domain-containing protein [Sulfurimonas sp.]